MITDLVDRATPAAVSARSSSGKPSPPIASPPTLRNDRRETPSQYRCARPNNVSMAPTPSASATRSPGSPAFVQHQDNLRERREVVKSGASGRSRPPLVPAGDLPSAGAGTPEFMTARAPP